MAETIPTAILLPPNPNKYGVPGNSQGKFEQLVQEDLIQNSKTGGGGRDPTSMSCSLKDVCDLCTFCVYFRCCRNDDKLYDCSGCGGCNGC